DSEHRNLEFLTRFDSLCEHDTIRHIKTLDRRRAWITGAPRNLSVDPHFSVVVDKDRQHRFRACGFEITDFWWNRQIRTIPDERDVTTAAARSKICGLDCRPLRIVETAFSSVRLDVI